jgi:RNA polymerase sigma-70 factor, ECF subfamily
LRDEHEFEDFYAAVFDQLVGQLFLVTGNLQDAEDAVQEALTRAAVRWPRLRRYRAPEAWVRRVAMNLASDGFRRFRRRLAVVVLHHLLDLSVEEVAAELGVPVGTVKSRLARARGTLAARLGPGAGAEGPHAQEGAGNHG